MSDISITFTSFLSFNKPVPKYKFELLAAIAQLSGKPDDAYNFTPSKDNSPPL